MFFLHTDKFLKVTSEVRDAILTNRPIVALESAIITHGMPYPHNLKCVYIIHCISYIYIHTIVINPLYIIICAKRHKKWIFSCPR